MAHIHSVVDTDSHFVINPTTREVTNANSKKANLIQYDHNSERFTFEIPRYVEEHDMSKCNLVEIHYINLDVKTNLERKGYYIADDLKVEGDKVTCSWLVSANATQLVGTLHFIVRFCCKENGVVTYAWNTAVCKLMQIGTGINASENFETEYVDVIEQWKDSVLAGFAHELVVEAKKAATAQYAELTARVDNLIASPAADDAELIDIRVGADGVTYDSAGTAVRSAKRMFVNLAGTEQVSPKNIYGVKVDGENLFDMATLYARGKYVDVVNGAIVLQDSSGLDTYIIPVDGVSKYSFTNCRTAVIVGEDKRTVIRQFSSAALNSTKLDSTDGAYIIFSFNYTRFPVGTYVISLGETLQKPTYQMPDWTGIPQIQKRLGNVEERNSIAPSSHIEGDLRDGSHLLLNTFTNVRKNEIVSFHGDIGSFGVLEIGFSTNEDTIVRSAYMTVDSTDVTINFNYSGELKEAHGLAIGQNITVILTNDGVNLDVTVISNGERYKKTVPYVRFAVSTPYCKMTDGLVTNCKLSWNAYDVKKPIWLFGDSYFSITSTTRWMTYLHEAGFTDNALVSSHAGATSVEAWKSLETLCVYGLPQVIVWCMGMNDGSDNNAQQWFTYRDKLLTFCEENNITPVFATIPSVPNINHEEKNTWIRSSAYRYVDFAKAVGADSSGTWFDGMLSTDGIHPTEKGAKSLYGRFMVDFPEITIQKHHP